MRYREFAPHRLSPFVACTWERTGAGAVTVLPDGCVDLVWDAAGGLSVDGADREPIEHGCQGALVGIRARPGAAGALLGYSIDEVPPGRSPLDAIWGRAAEELAERLAEAPSLGARRTLLEAAATRRFRQAEPDRLVLDAIAVLDRPRARVDTTAEAVFLGSRQLQRRFRAQVGYGPKLLDRVLRFRRFLAQADAVASGRLSLAETALRLGYADQPHLARDCARLARRTPAQLVADWGYAPT